MILPGNHFPLRLNTSIMCPILTTFSCMRRLIRKSDKEQPPETYYFQLLWRLPNDHSRQIDYETRRSTLHWDHYCYRRRTVQPYGLIELRGNGEIEQGKGLKTG